MTNKPMLSVELRTLLERASNNLCSGEEAYAVQQELRALLDMPEPKRKRKPFAWYRVPKDFPLQGAYFPYIEGQSERDIQNSLEAEFGFNVKRLYDEPAAQHQDSNPGWPDPLESTLAKEIINNPSAFDLAIRDLFDKLCREIQAGRYYRRFSGSEPMEFTANQGEPVAVVHTMKSIMEAVEASRCYTVLTSDQCHALAQSLNGVNK